MYSHSRKKLLFTVVVSGFLINSGFSQSIQQKKEINSKSIHSLSSSKTTIKVPTKENNSEIDKQKQVIVTNFHFENERLTAEVSNKVNFNKTHQKPLSEGILKSYKVSIKACNNVENTKKTFSFLYNSGGFVKADFLSEGLVNLIVIPEYNSVNLKEKMLSKQLNFNFISESYFLK